MTILLYQYKNRTQTAGIEQEKYCLNYRIYITDDRHNTLVLRRNYLSIKTAKQAIKKYMGHGYSLVYDYYKNFDVR